MKKLKVISPSLILFILFYFGSLGQSKMGEEDNIIGLYWSPKKDAKIEIFKTGEFYFGKSIWVAIQKKDIENPNESLRKREVLGIELLSNFSYKNGEYTNGQVYDPENGKIYSCKMSLIGDKLKVRGYIGISLFGRTEFFERIRTK
jgi:uncharacterized protein (DUF2147 family)